MRKAAVSAATLVLATAILTGCASDEPIRGTIVEKDYEPEQWNTEKTPRFKQKCTTKTVNKRASTSCKQFPDGFDRVDVYTPPCHELELEDGREVCVDEDVWNNLAVDETYDSSKY